MLYPDDPGFQSVVQEINRRYPGAPLNVTIAQAWEGGTFMPINSNPVPGGHPVLLLQSSNHYEAVVMSSTRRTVEAPPQHRPQQRPDSPLRLPSASGPPQSRSDLVRPREAEEVAPRNVRQRTGRGR
jgi:hypothetical protein